MMIPRSALATMAGTVNAVNTPTRAASSPRGRLPMAVSMRDERPLGHRRKLQRLETRRNLAEQAIRLFEARGFRPDHRGGDRRRSRGPRARSSSTSPPRRRPPSRTTPSEWPTSWPASTPPRRTVIRCQHLRGVLLAGFDSTSPSRLTRYTLLSKVPELRDEDARTDRDYEEAIQSFLRTIGASRPRQRCAPQRSPTQSSAWCAPPSSLPENGASTRGVTSEILQRMLGTPFDEPLHSM